VRAGSTTSDLDTAGFCSIWIGDTVNHLAPIRPTIKDVARAANVSSSTVSYILNNNRASERISEGTKRRVWEAVESLGYKFNPIGRALQRGYTDQVILLIVTWNLATSHAATAMAISRSAASLGLALTVHVAEDDQSAEAFVRRSTLHNLGGVLVLWDSPAFQHSSLRQLAHEGLPIIDLLPGSPDGIAVVTADREQAGYLATQHLISLGHKCIGFIGDAATRPKTTLRQLAGYRKALEEAGLVFDPNFVENVTEYGFEGGQRGLRAALERCPQITAFFCINDAIALGVIDAAQELGRLCPRDISVIGFGDSPEGNYWRPKLTTIALSSGLVAERALELVMEFRKDQKVDSRVVLIPEDLVLRESTGKARDSQ